MDWGSNQAPGAALATGMPDGMEMGYRRLDGLLAERVGV